MFVNMTARDWVLYTHVGGYISSIGIDTPTESKTKKGQVNKRL